MSKPEQYSAAELADALRQYGDMPVAVSIVDAADRQGPIVDSLRLEMTPDPEGRRRVILAGYTDQEGGAS
jgi:hypothetical protein